MRAAHRWLFLFAATVLLTLELSGNNSHHDDWRYGISRRRNPAEGTLLTRGQVHHQRRASVAAEIQA